MKRSVLNEDMTEFINRLESEISVAEISGTDTDKLAGFTKELYSGEFNAAHYSDINRIKEVWEWKYGANPASQGINNFGWMALHRGIPVGQFRIIPTAIKIGKKYIPGTCGTDLAVLKKYRNIGISNFLVKKVKEKIREKFGLHLICGMNPSSYIILKESGFTDMGIIPRLVRILDLRAILICYGIPGFLSSFAQGILDLFRKIASFGSKAGKDGINVEEVEGFDEDFQKFWDSVSEYYGCIAKRDVNTLTWRYKNQPLWPYTVLRVRKNGEMRGFTVLREGRIKDGRLKNRPMGIISDILVYPKDGKSARALLNETIKFFSDPHKNMLLIKCDILNKRVEDLLRKSGFIRIKSPNGFVLDTGKLLSDEDKRLAAARDAWLITSGDSDLDFY
ncbi:MAG: hypothetical protein A2Z72_08430 [Omnitrophica bacterium RBG_13_46_9]|nr:MAG: hypothetical protein A2Z72_08430 [Omnitrophica bacterium RBG_13_46_9]